MDRLDREQLYNTAWKHWGAEAQAYCCPPDWLTKSGFKCPSALPMQPGDITNKCGASDADLMTEEEWEAQQMEEKSRMNRDDREMKGHQRK